MEWYWWALFLGIVAILMGADLGLFQRKAHEVKLREALQSTALRVFLALFFCLALYLGWIGSYDAGAERNQASMEFLTAYIVEIALSIDNVFVFALIFRYFRVPAEFQHRVLFWGILGALIMRAIMIFAGIALIERFHWVIYVFAFVLIYGGIKMIRHDVEDTDPSENPLLKLFKRFVPVSKEMHGTHFVTRAEGGRLMATPLCLVLIAIETTDLIFAVDSIPAVLAVSRDPFIVFTSNVFAIIGLRALYFALASLLPLFRYLHYGLSAVLVFIGTKMLLSSTPYKIETVQSLIVVIVLLTVSVAASLLIKDKSKTPKLPPEA